MPFDAALPLHVALQTVLDAALKTDMNVEVFDHVPPNTPFPYVVIGDGKYVANDTKDLLGQTHTLDVLVFTNTRGRAEALTIIEKIRATMADSELNMDDFNTVFSRFISGSVELMVDDPEKPLWVGTATFEIETEAKL